MLLGFLSAYAQETQQPLPYWRDVHVTHVGREASRTEFTSFPTQEEALNGHYRQSPWYQSLNGTWKFLYTDDARTLPTSVTDASFDATAWSDITVPGNWERQGFGTAIYVNQPYEFATVNPNPPDLPDAVPAGVYQRFFEVPSAWAGRDIYLNLDGAKSGVYVYVNGHQVGYNENAKDRAQYRINDYLQKGQNTLTVKMYRWSTGSWLECQDFWRISGFERDVYLTSQPQAALWDFTVLSTLDESLTNGVFQLDAVLRNPNGVSMQTSYRLLDAQGKCVAQGTQTASADKVSFQATIPHVLPWSAEVPTLYTLLIAVGTPEGATEYTPYAVGFRRFELKGDQFLVNGQPVKFKGVNIHEHNMVTGHYVSMEDMRKDLEIMRQNNINAVRTSHYPQPREFYELCDQIGLYVYCEANIESHGMYYDLNRGRSLGNNRDFLDAHLYRISDMYERCKNFPCVTIWSLGNEAGNGYNFYRAYEWIEAREKGPGLMNRPICYERALWEWNTDMYVPQYPSADWFARIGERGSDRPIMPSEYSHAMGNSNGGLWKQWQQIYAYPHLQGAFIWDWVDQGMLEHDAQGVRYWAYGGDYGTRTPSDANFCCNGIVNPDRTPHPAMAEVKYAYANVGFENVTPQGATALQIKVTNRFYFTDLSPYTIRYTLTGNGVPAKTGTFTLQTPPQMTDTLTIPLNGVKMNDTATYWVNLEVVTRQEDRLIPAGHVLAQDQFPVREFLKPAVTLKAGKPATVTETDRQYVLTSKNVTLTIDRQTGYAVSYKANGRECFYQDFGIRPNFWRAPTDNDYGNGMPSRTHVWKEAGHVAASSVTASTQGENATVTATYHLPAGNAFLVTYTLMNTGAVHVGTQFTPVEQRTDRDGKILPQPEVPRIGVRFRMPASFDNFSYFGRGPQENYADRKAGTLVGLYHASAEASYFPYVRPQESGHHCDVRFVRFPRFSIYADDCMEFNALRHSIEDLDSEEATAHDYQWRNLSPDDANDPASARNRLRRHHHANDVVARDFVEVCLDYRMMGVGGYDSWGSRPDKECQVDPCQGYEWGFTILPL